MSYKWPEKDEEENHIKDKEEKTEIKATVSKKAPKPQPVPKAKPQPVPLATKTCAVRLTADRQVRLHKGEPVYGVTEDEIAKLRKAHFVS